METKDKGLPKLKRYAVTGNNIEFLMTNYIMAKNIQEAKELFIEKWNEGNIAVNNSEIIFQSIKREEIK
jgi:hypothetical protein